MTPGTNEILALCAAGFVAGLVDAMAGGGGLITVPALLAVGLPPHVALGTNKGQSIWGTLAATWGFHRAGALDHRRARVTFPSALVGAAAGCALLMRISPQALRPVVLALLVVAALVVALRGPGRAKLGAAPRRDDRRARLIAGAIALSLGAYDGFFGPGTGTFLIVAFTTLLGESATRASGDAKVVNLASNATALALFLARGLVIWRIAAPMALANLLGGAVGARLAVRGGDAVVRRMVLAVTACLVARLAVDLLRR